MLQVVTDEFVEWQCFGGEEGEWCERINHVPLSLARYIPLYGEGKGAVIALPHCSCGTQTFYKADLTIKDLFRVVHPVQREDGHIWAYVLPLRFVRALRLHHWLSSHGMAEFAPVVTIAPPEVLEHPTMAGLDMDVICAFWWGFQAVKTYRPEMLAAGQEFLLLPPGNGILEEE